MTEEAYAAGTDALLVLKTSAAVSNERLRALQAAYDDSGYWPLELWGPLDEINSGGLKGDEAVAAADLLDAPTVVQAWAAYRRDEEEAMETEASATNEALIRDALDTFATQPERPAGDDDERFEAPIFEIALVPAAPPDSVAWLGMGDYNECPGPEELTAVLRAWFRDYAAVPVAIGSDTVAVEFRALPPDGSHLGTLVRDCCALCSDLLMSMPENALALVRSLAQRETVVPFWWD